MFPFQIQGSTYLFKEVRGSLRLIRFEWRSVFSISAHTGLYRHSRAAGSWGWEWLSLNPSYHRSTYPQRPHLGPVRSQVTSEWSHPRILLLWYTLSGRSNLGSASTQLQIFRLVSEKGSTHPFPLWLLQWCSNTHIHSRRNQWKSPAQSVRKKPIDLTRMIVKGKARNCNIKHSGNKGFYFFFIKVLLERK